MTKTPIIALALMALLTPVTVQAAGSKTAEATITAVTANSITIHNGAHAGLKMVKIDSDGLRNTQTAANIDTYTVKPWTTITLNNLPAKLSDLTPGLKVYVSQGTDRTVAESIVAMTIPPAQVAKATPQPRVAANAKAPAKPAGKGTKKLGEGVDAYKVTAVTADTITVAQDGGRKSISFKTGRFTDIFVNGERKIFSDIKVGMEVAVVASTDPTMASSIKAIDK